MIFSLLCLKNKLLKPFCRERQSRFGTRTSQVQILSPRISLNILKQRTSSVSHVGTRGRKTP